MDKTYHGVLRLGVATDTYDRAGTPIGPPREVRVGRTEVQAAFERFRGTVQQMPPVFSAKKVRGTPMYRLARRHRPVAPTPTTVTFHTLELLGMRGHDLEFTARVSAGTYLRTFAQDVGAILGCGAHLYALRRSSVGPFRVEDAILPEDLRREGAGALARVLPLEDVPLEMPTLVLTPSGTHAIRHGRPCPLSEVALPRPPLPPGRCRLKGPEGRLVGIGVVQLQAPSSEGRPLVRPQIVFAG
jgi:tRNA pseudouridine55 synthase